MSGYWYLATPYTKFPGGPEAAYRMAAEQAGVLTRAGVPVFSPIAHSHTVATLGDVDPLDWELWMKADAPLLEAAKGIIMLEADTWQSSVGMYAELVNSVKAGKPVVFMQPGVVPEELTQPRDSQPAVQGDALDRFIASLDKAEAKPVVTDWGNILAGIDTYDNPRRYTL